MILKSKTFANEDASGNRIYLRIFYDESDSPVNANVHLKLSSEGAPRMLGSYEFGTRTFYCRRKTSKHLHRKTNSFGFNWTILGDDYLRIENVYVIVDDELHYRFKKSAMDEFGRFLNFKQQGFELQRFMSYDLIKRYSDIPPRRENPSA